METENPEKFRTGSIVITPGIQDILDRDEQVVLKLPTLLMRHVRGDWGEVEAEDAAVNDKALHDGERLLSVYRLGGERVYVLTEADRSATTVLLPEEY